MTRAQLIQNIFSSKSYLCIGLDTDVNKIPAYLGSDADAVFSFNKEIIDATSHLCVAYKINTAFYEAMGTAGWEAMEKTVNYIPSTHFKIADAKRGDIGNTSSQYAKAFFDPEASGLSFDAITVSPYMGEDSIKPFLEFENKWTIVLGLTSNTGAADFEMQRIADGNIYLYEKVLNEVSNWGTAENLMFVIGATQTEQLQSIRKIIPENFLLIPGVGAQGGSLKDVSAAAMTKDCGLLVNVSRKIIFASCEEDFADEAKKVAEKYQKEMEEYLQKYKQ